MRVELLGTVQVRDDAAGPAHVGGPRARAHPARASAVLRQALALWRGPALAGLPAAGPTAGIAARLEELRRSATADRIDADLAMADPPGAAGLTAELRVLVAEDPLAERPRPLLMRALYLAGRQADALAVYADARTQLANQLGVDPSPQLEQVYLGVLRRSLPEASSPASPGRQAGGASAISGTAAAPPTTLRVPLTSLVGRDDQVVQVEVLTSENRLVTLTGPGGVGKTRLAAEVAGRVAARARGGAWLVDLAPLSDPGDVPYAALTAVGIRDRLLAGSGGGEGGQATEPGASPAPDPASRLVSGLRERSGLIVLDNCEHLIEAVAGLADAVLSGCPGIRILAASREALGITGETVCPVPPLPVPPVSAADQTAAISAAASVRLLADRARAVRPGFAVTDANAADVARICRMLDGAQLPWLGLLAAESGNMHAALRWAVERRDAGTALRFGAALTWHWYLCGQIGDGAGLAKAALALDEAGPQRTDRATAEARAICAVAVAVGANWDLETAREPLDAAAAAAAADPSGGPQHPLVMLGRTQAARFSGEPGRWLELLTGYLDSADAWVGAMARLHHAIVGLTLGRVGQASRDCDAALAYFRDTGEIWGTVMALTFRAELDRLAGDYRGAIAALEEAVALDRQLADASEDLAWLYQQLAGLRVRTGDYAAAHAVLDLADQNAWAQRDSGPYLRLVRAELAWREGRLAEAARHCEDILRAGPGKPASWAPLRALATARLGVLGLEAGDIARGTALLRDALAAALRTAGAERAAALLGAADSIRCMVDHSSLDAPGIRAAAREQLGEAAFDAAYRRGLGMAYAEALSFAQAGAVEAGLSSGRAQSDQSASPHEP